MPWERIVTQQAGKIFCYTDWRDPLPRVPKSILNSIVYLYRDIHEAESGAEIGGSGCLMSMPSNVPGHEHIYVVTNAHVIEEGATIPRVNLQHLGSGLQRTLSFPFEASSWMSHPQHDFAVRPLPPDATNLGADISFIDIDNCVLSIDIDRGTIGPGDDLFYVGRFRDHAGRYENQPSVRFGNISMLPNDREPIEDDNLRHRRKQIGYLVEARSRSGYSGSPVFIYWSQTYGAPGIFGAGFGADIRQVKMNPSTRFLGIDWGHLQEVVRLADGQTNVELAMVAKVHAGMMGVVPSWYIRDFILQAPRLQEQRMRDDEFHLNTKHATGACD